jgi:hypothetical protein
MMLDDASFGMYDHKAAVVAERSRFLGNTVLRELVLELL